VISLALVASGLPATAQIVTDAGDAVMSAVDVTPEPIATPSPEPSPFVTPAPSPTPEPPPAPDEAEEAEEAVSPSTDTLAAAIAPTIPTSVRLSGADRFATSIAASRAAFPSGAGTVLIVNAAASVDATVAAGMAASLEAPLLYVQTSSVPSAVLTELRRLAPTSIVVVGGTAVVADAALVQLRSVAADVRRFGGADRYETSRLALLRDGATADTVYLAGGANLIDAPLASVAAATTGRGAMLVNGLAPLDAATLAALREVDATSLVIVGGLGTVTAAFESSLRAGGFTVSRRAGADRNAQSVLLARERTSTVARAIVVNSTAAPDVAVAAALAAATRQPLLYAIEKCVPDAVSGYIDQLGVSVTAIGGTSVLEAPVLANESCTVVRARLQASLNAAIRSTIARYPGTYSVTVHQIGGLGEVTHVSGGTRREPASMMKIFAAWAAYKRVEEGRATLSTPLPSGVTLGTCIQIMIHVSDNYCHTDIAHWIGIPQLNAMIRGAGFTNTLYGTVPRGTSVLYAGNRTTTNDLAWMMQRLANRSILSKPYADALISHMRSQIWRSRIASGIPPGTQQASKPGALWIASGLMQGDTAIVNGARYSYVISIIGDDGPPQAALRAISRTVYTHFHGSFGAAATYPVQQMVTRTASLLRSSPGGPVVATIPAGRLIQVHDAQRVWYQVQYGSRKLWVYYTGLRNR